MAELNTIAVIEVKELQQLKEQNQRIEDKLSKLEQKNHSETYIPSVEIPKLLNISQKTWQTWRDRRYFKFIQLGSKIWVKRSDLEAFLDSHYITPKA